MTRITTVLALATVCVFWSTLSNTNGAAGNNTGLSIARAYIAGMETGDWEKLNSLFLDDERSSILENASDEGSWEHYRDHHLKPEVDAVDKFRFAVKKESEEQFGNATLAQLVGSFTFEIDDELRSYRAAVSFVIANEGGKQRIAHIHWSSRPEQKQPIENRHKEHSHEHHKDGHDHDH